MPSVRTRGKAESGSRALSVAVLALAACALSAPAAQAAPPTISGSAISSVTETTATLRGKVDTAARAR
jgi:hypothetical protein